MEREKEIDVERSYAAKETVAKLRRLADALEAEKTFEIQIGDERIYVPPYATIEFEYERGEGYEEIEIEFRWKRSE
ncbi:MAG: amphi-Trp domain-containing protein [Acidobacteriota bacterium]|nr:amphi-Trp domain-containing protein [Acidobacteriota bacterium]